jgi:hypothetical protein
MQLRGANEQQRGGYRQFNCCFFHFILFFSEGFCFFYDCRNLVVSEKLKNELYIAPSFIQPSKAV